MTCSRCGHNWRWRKGTQFWGWWMVALLSCLPASFRRAAFSALPKAHYALGTLAILGLAWMVLNWGWGVLCWLFFGCLWVYSPRTRLPATALWLTYSFTNCIGWAFSWVGWLFTSVIPWLLYTSIYIGLCLCMIGAILAVGSLAIEGARSMRGTLWHQKR